MADPDLELRGVGGAVLIFLPCWSFSLQSFLFLPKIRGGGGPGHSSPRSATDVWNVKTSVRLVASFLFNIIRWLDCDGMWHGTLNNAIQVQTLTLPCWIEWTVNGYACIITNCCFPDLPPPPPEAFNDPDDDSDKHVQSRTFKMLQDAVEAGGWVVFGLFLTLQHLHVSLIHDVYPVQWHVSAETLTKGSIHFYFIRSTRECLWQGKRRPPQAIKHCTS